MEYANLAALEAAIAQGEGAAELVAAAIQAYRQGEAYRQLVMAREHYENRSVVQEKTNTHAQRSNVRLEIPLLRRLVDQKLHCVLAKPFGFTSESAGYAEALRGIRGLEGAIWQGARDLVALGCGYLMPCIDGEGRFRMEAVAPETLVPLWTPTGELTAGIRFSGGESTISEAAYWNGTGVSYFVNHDGALVADSERPGHQKHFSLAGEAQNWPAVPIAVIGNEGEACPLGYALAGLTDELNWQASMLADALREVPRFVYRLQNNGGTELDKLVTELREQLAVRLEGDGTLTGMAQEPAVAGTLRCLERGWRALYACAGAVDAAELGAVPIEQAEQRCLDLRGDCYRLAAALRAALENMKPLLDAGIRLTGGEDYANGRFAVSFSSLLPGLEDL